MIGRNEQASTMHGGRAWGVMSEREIIAELAK